MVRLFLIVLGLERGLLVERGRFEGGPDLEERSLDRSEADVPRAGGLAFGEAVLVLTDVESRRVAGLVDGLVDGLLGVGFDTAGAGLGCEAIWLVEDSDSTLGIDLSAS